MLLYNMMESFTKSLKTANDLLSPPQDIVVLHGDLRHGNILNFGQRGWLAIDPKHIAGGRGFDFANMFCNPDREMALQPTFKELIMHNQINHE